jgi:CRP-like cAMP-binding protein
VIFRNKALAALDREDADALRGHMREMAVVRGQGLFEPGDRVLTVYFPSTAVLSEVIVFEDGRSIEAATLGAEGAAGLLACLSESRCVARVFAQVAGAVIAVEGAALRARAQESPRLQKMLLRHVEASHLQAQQGLACVAFHYAQQRLARWLLMTADRTGTDSFLLTQDYLAIMVGVQRTTINGAANHLKAMGVIHYSRGLVRILDRPRLEAQACECYAVLRDRQTALIGPV